MLVSKKFKNEMNHLEIWSQRYHDRKALVASWKIQTHNRITFKSASMAGREYYISGQDIRKCELVDMKAKSGNTVKMYAVPLEKLQILEYKEDLAEYAISLFDH